MLVADDSHVSITCTYKYIAHDVLHILDLPLNLLFSKITKELNFELIFSTSRRVM